MTFVAPRIVNDFSCRIYHEMQFAWQAHYLVKLEGLNSCSARCK